MRNDGRRPNQLRPVTMETGVLDYPEGSCLITTGKTKVLCAATIERDLPRWLRDGEKGWVTAEYNMLPRSNRTRSRREGRHGNVGGRTLEIQRLIGRACRAVVDLKAMPHLQIILDCDVIQADGGTRTASITGAYIALVEALRMAKKKNMIETIPLKDQVAAISVGKVDGKILLDLDYSEDVTAEVDANFVMTGKGEIVEVQGTAEGDPFTEAELSKMLKFAKTGIRKLIAEQRKIIKPKLIISRRS